jgi:hypothetical protein
LEEEAEEFGLGFFFFFLSSLAVLLHFLLHDLHDEKCHTCMKGDSFLIVTTWPYYTYPWLCSPFYRAHDEHP